MSTLVLKSEAQGFSNLSTDEKIKTVIEDAKNIIASDGYYFNNFYNDNIKQFSNEEYEKQFVNMAKSYSINYDAIKNVCNLLKNAGCKLAYIAVMFLDGILPNGNANVSDIIGKYVIGDNKLDKVIKTNQKPKEITVNKTAPVNKDLNTGKTGAAKIVENLNNHVEEHAKVNEVPKDIDKLSIIRQHISKDNGAEFTFKNQQQIDNVADLISNPITKNWLAKCGYDGDLNNPQFFLLNGQSNVIYKTKYPDAGYDMLLSTRTNIPGHVILIEFNTLTKIFHICPVKKEEVFKKNSKKNKGKK